MDQEPTPTPQPSSGKSGIFQNINTTIAGVTGLVIAVGGLAATWDKIFPAKQAEAAATAPANEIAEAVPIDETATIEEESAEPEANAPTSYTGTMIKGGKALKIEWDDEANEWTVTEGDEPYAYDDTASKDATKYMAVSNGNYLRWPIEGGEVDRSEDKLKWETFGSVDPVAEAASAE